MRLHDIEVTLTLTHQDLFDIKVGLESSIRGATVIKNDEIDEETNEVVLLKSIYRILDAPGEWEWFKTHLRTDRKAAQEETQEEAGEVEDADDCS